MKQNTSLLFLLFFMPICLSAQISLMLEDETKTGFKLVIDGYLQNEQSLKKVNLQKLEAGAHDLIFLMDDGQDLRRKINLEQSLNYQYVLHRNFRGERKLRFRGSHTKLSQSALVLDFNRSKEYIDLANAIAVIDSLPHFKKVPETQPMVKIPEIIIKKDSVKVKVIAANLPAKDASAPLGTKPKEVISALDTVSTTSPTKNAAAETVHSVNAFSVLQNSIQLNNFEFDKIKMIEEFLGAEQIIPSQLEILLKELKYDQSRLQILKTVASKQVGLKEDKGIFIATLDYELSRQKAQTFFP